MSTSDAKLFRGPLLGDIFRQRQERIFDEIDGMDIGRLMNVDDDELCDELLEKHAFHVPELTDRREGKVEDTSLPVEGNSDATSRPATRITRYVPFEGDEELLLCQPSRGTIFYPQCSVRIQDGEIILTRTITDHDSASVRREFEHVLRVIQENLQQVGRDVEEFRQSMRPAVLRRIAARREKLQKDGLLFEQMGFRPRRREDAPATYKVPVVRKQPKVSQPPGKAPAGAGEPFLLPASYDEILRDLEAMGAVIERSPEAFRIMDEESLRWLFLVPLNLQYEGQATGETFNFGGKTDILIRWQGANIFVAECKIWRGPRYLEQAIDQLLGYVTWHDTKTAILVFNRTKDFSSVLGKIQETVLGHPNCLRALEYGSERGFRYNLHHPDDIQRELLLTVLAFEVPS